MNKWLSFFVRSFAVLSWLPVLIIHHYYLNKIWFKCLVIFSEPTVEFIKNDNGRMSLYVDGSLFYRTTTTKKKMYWRCRLYRNTGWISTYSWAYAFGIILIRWISIAGVGLEFAVEIILMWMMCKLSIVITIMWQRNMLFSHRQQSMNKSPSRKKF